MVGNWGFDGKLLQELNLSRTASIYYILACISVGAGEKCTVAPWEKERKKDGFISPGNWEMERNNLCTVCLAIYSA
jgi:hypothetical protein